MGPTRDSPRHTSLVSVTRPVQDREWKTPFDLSPLSLTPQGLEHPRRARTRECVTDNQRVLPPNAEFALTDVELCFYNEARLGP